MKDCTTCKYGYEDERLGIPMCHHPKRFSEDCVDSDFRMYEEKETKESERPMRDGLEEAEENFTDLTTPKRVNVEHEEIKRWRPSPEQLEALEYVIRDYRDSDCNHTANYLQEIYKKIKEL